MKIITSFVFCTLFYALAFSQAKPKKENSAPTAKDMDDMIRQAQEAVKNIDPETKRMLDSMGVKLPTVKPVPKGTISDKQLADAWDEQTMVIPRKDVQRIAALPKAILSNTALPAFVQRVHSGVLTKIPAATKAAAEQVYQAVKKESSSTASVANAATGLWINGNASMALYLMGKAALDDPSDADNLNNYAAFLTMTGAEEAAIPVLLNLNKRFPKNSTILNNIGQAWFGLGDIDKALNYLDSAVLIYALHPQANYTRCMILESKGDPVKAIEALKRSIAEAYSKEKENKLRQLKYELKGDDLNWDFPMPVDALGLERFFLPHYPLKASESAMRQQQWKAFRFACNEKIKELEAKNTRLREELEQQALRVQQEMLQAVASKKKFTQPVLVPFYHSKAIKKLIYLVDDKDGSMAYKRQRIGAEEQKTIQHVRQLNKQMNDELAKLSKRMHVASGGEDGPKVTEEEYCAQSEAIIDKYLPEANNLLHNIRLQHLEFVRKTLNNQAYFNMFAMDALTFEYYKNGAKIGWLNELAKSPVEFWKCERTANKQEEENASGHTLPDFDDIHCDRHVEFYFFSTTLKLDCSRLTSQINLPVLKTSVTENLNSNELIRGTVEVGYFKGGTLKQGPVKGEFKAEAGVTIEFDRSGVTDVGVRGKAMAGDKIGGLDARYGWNSGGSLNAKGVLRGLK